MLLNNIRKQIGHNIYQSLKEVHEALIDKYNIEKNATNDIARAKIMERYLRTFKGLAQSEKNSASFKKSYSEQMDMQAIIAIAESVQQQIAAQSPNGKAGRLFQNVHQRFVGKNAIAGVDDIFELELTKLLNTAVQHASTNKGAVDLTTQGAEVIGRELGNIPKEAIKALETHGNELVQKTSKSGLVINAPEFRSAKADVEGYKASILITADIKPEWREFMTVFTGARFTVKNYMSGGQETIHLGATDTRKSIIASLLDLGVASKDAVHFYYHSQRTKKTSKEHILHLRFAYELSGAGLVDSQGNNLQAADFFIYNDPTSSNIYVRSTKEMIANMMKYTPKFKDPYKSHIVILKTSFS